MGARRALYQAVAVIDLPTEALYNLLRLSTGSATRFGVRWQVSEQRMPIDYGDLNVGQRISDRTHLLDAALVSRYADAVEDRAGPRSSVDGRHQVPPMAIAALSLRGVLQDLAIPGGTLHVGQELEFHRALEVGAKLDCRATLAQNSVRGEWRFLVVELEVVNGAGVVVMTGKSTIIVPVS